MEEHDLYQPPTQEDAMIEFNTVTREVRSLVHRRRMLMTFLGSLFVATSLFLHNVLKGKLPHGLEPIKEYIFTFYALIVMVPTLLLGLRMARLSAGMTLNGILYARLMQDQDWTRRGDPQRAARHNPLGVSFVQFLQMNLFAGASATLLAISLDAHLLVSIGVGVAVFGLWLAMYFRGHHKAVDFAMQKIASEPCAPFERKEWLTHVSTSMEDANAGLLADVGFVGLIMFSVFEKLTGLTEITRENAGSAYQDVQTYGPWVYCVLMLVTCLFGMFVYLRVRVAIGGFSLQLDPTDQPFRPLRLTDSLLGYMLLAFLFVVALHLVLTLALPEMKRSLVALLAVDVVAFALAVAAEQWTIVVAGRRYRQA
jgi:hypothetical protein